MPLEKTTVLINSCDAAFKRRGLLRLAESPSSHPRPESKPSAFAGSMPPIDRTANVLGQSSSEPSLSLSGRTQPHGADGMFGNAAVDLNLEPHLQPEEQAPHEGRHGLVRPLGIPAVDTILPSGGLPTGKVIELSLSGGAACGTQMALWACRAAQQQAQLNGTESWCAFIDPSASLHAPGVLSNGVSLTRLLVLRPAFEDVERVALRLSEANVFSVIIIDLVGVPWLSARAAARSTRPGPQLELNAKRQNWNRTVRQLALRLEHTQACVIVLTDAEAHRSLPLPVALRLHMRADARGVSLQVVKESQGRVGARGTVPWAEWGHESANPLGEESEAQAEQSSALPRAKTLPLPRYGESREGRSPDSQRSSSLVRTPDRNGRETEIPVVASSRLARTSRASL